MALVTLTKEDVLRSKIVDPGKYLLKIGKVEVKPSQTDGKPVYYINQTIVSGTFEGVPILKTISIKMPKLLIQLFGALGNPIDENGGTLDTDFLVDKEVGGLVKTAENVDGSDKNDVVAYFPVTDL